MEFSIIDEPANIRSIADETVDRHLAHVGYLEESA